MKKNQLTESQTILLQVFQSNPDHWIQFYAKKDINGDLNVYNVDKVPKYFVSYASRTGKITLLTKDRGINKQIQVSLKQIDAWFLPADLINKMIKLKQKIETFGEHEDKVRKIKEEDKIRMAPRPKRDIHRTTTDDIDKGFFVSSEENDNEE